MNEVENNIDHIKDPQGGGSITGVLFFIVIIAISSLFAFIAFEQNKNMNSKRSYSTTESDDANIYDTAIDAGEPLLDAANRQVIDDSIKQYQIVERSGNVIDMCVHAGMVKAAYLQANDEGGYKNWSDITSKVCKAAGMPGM